MKKVVTQHVVVGERGAQAFCYWQEGSATGSLSCVEEDEGKAKRKMLEMMRSAGITAQGFEVIQDPRRRFGSRTAMQAVKSIPPASSGRAAPKP